MVILGVVGTYLTTNLVATSLENRIADQLVHAQDAALDAAVKLQGRQVAAVRLVANTEGVDRAVRAGVRRHLAHLSGPRRATTGWGPSRSFNPAAKTTLRATHQKA